MKLRLEYYHFLSAHGWLMLFLEWLSCLSPFIIRNRVLHFLFWVQELIIIHAYFGERRGSRDLFMFWGESESQKQWICHHPDRTQTHKGSSNWWSQYSPSYWKKNSRGNRNSNLFKSKKIVNWNTAEEGQFQQTSKTEQKEKVREKWNYNNENMQAVLS